MIKYDVYYGETHIGRLYINEEGQYKYVADMDGIKKAEEKEDIVIIADARNDRDWGTPIAFFDNRIETCKKIGETETVRYPNSEYCFIKDNSGAQN